MLILEQTANDDHAILLLGLSFSCDLLSISQLYLEFLLFFYSLTLITLSGFSSFLNLNMNHNFHEDIFRLLKKIWV